MLSTGNADAIGLIVAVVILLLAFGSVVAMSLPIGTALLGLVAGVSLIYLLAVVANVGTGAPTLATMIGLGVGIDYSLIILTRHRQNLTAGMDVITSIGLANGTAGQAVLFAGVLAVALAKPGATGPAETVTQAVSRISEVQVIPAQFNTRRDAAVILVTPKSAPQSAATENLVNRLRATVLPAAVNGTGATVYVGGITASYIDLGQRIQNRLPLFIGAVVGLLFILLMMVFRSVLVALKAAIMNLLSIGASFGVIVAVFQWGWLKGLVGLSETTQLSPMSR
jgi:uncharacterized membrane protein YdfJ with MMPL/SSD domain